MSRYITVALIVAALGASAVRAQEALNGSGKAKPRAARQSC